MSNGVRQGDVSSPSCLINAYINELLVALRQGGYGAKLAVYRVGCIAYANDIRFVFPNVHGLQSMLSICKKFVQKNMLNSM